ncbi:MAG: glycosyltransferase family 9 protein [Gammaproteobacteria bacterium]
MAAETPQKICLLRLSAIGDTCNVVPTVRQLQKAFPNCSITWIIGAVEHRLLGSFPGVEFITVDKTDSKKAARKLRKQIKSVQYDVLLHMHASMRANLVSRHIRAHRKIGFDRGRARDFQWLFCKESIEAKQNSHVVDGFLQFAEHLGVATQPPQWNLAIAPEAADFARRYTRKPSLIISPCSSDRRQNFRNWSIENYIRLARYATDEFGLQVILTGGPTDLEKDYGQRIGAEAAVTNLIGNTSLPQLLALLQQARVVVCPDSGPAHMANAVNTPVVGLFATSNRFRTGPYRSQDFAADRYPDAVEKYLHKTVDEVRWGQRVRDPDAMSLITFDDVAAQLGKVMQVK